MELAFLLSGQGGQKVGMGVELASSCDDCRQIFRTADRTLGFRLSKIMAHGPAEDLRRTEIAQPALLTLAVAHARHLISLGLMPDALAGHSLGQYAALVVAGALDFEDAVRLVAEGSKLMHRTVPESHGAMMAVVGLERELVYAACEAAQMIGVVTVALHNAPGQAVISGAYAAVNAAADRCEDAGGGVMPLSISVASHCELLSPMVPEFAKLIRAAELSDPRLPVIDNVTAKPLPDVAAVRRSLVAHLTAPVLFEESLRYLVDAGVRHFVQCGPGKGLLGFARRVTRAAEFETFKRAARRAASVQ
jgi:[acyl-carrier-protein] S-malonyltransferase